MVWDLPRNPMESEKVQLTELWEGLKLTGEL
jgi:hypothetical protein